MKKATFDQLQKSMEQAVAHAHGKITLKTKKVPMPPRITVIAPAEIRKIRKRFGASQAMFARFLNVSTTTAIKWETGRRKPSGSALRLLSIVSKRPEILHAA